MCKDLSDETLETLETLFIFHTKCTLYPLKLTKMEQPFWSQYGFIGIGQILYNHTKTNILKTNNKNNNKENIRSFI